MKYFIACLVILMGLVVIASALNSTHYYIEAPNGAVEIWQGKFAPMGKELLMTLPGVQPPEPVKEKYSKGDVYPLAFNYYIEKADTLLEMPGMPDFEGIKSYLNKALTYATTKDLTQIAYKRLDNIELMIFMYKAQVASSRGTLSDLENAKGYLGQAAKLDLDDLQSDMIAQKIDSIDESIAALKAEQAAEAPQPEALAEPAPAEPAHAD